MAQDKKGFILYADQKELFSQLSDEKAGQLIKHIFQYVNDEKPNTKDPLINLAFTPIKQQFKRDLQKWEKTREGRSKAGKASAEARRNKKEQESTNSTNVDSVKQTPTNPTVNVNDNVNVTVKEINNNNYYNTCLKDSAWLEVTCMQKKHKPDTIKKYLETFKNHLIQTAEQKQNLREFKSHFTNWLNKQTIVEVVKKDWSNPYPEHRNN